MNFILGGYYLVQGSSRQPWMDASLLPETLWSVSKWVCPIIPDAWIFSWVKKLELDPSEEEICALLQISSGDLKDLRRQFDQYLEEDRFGFPNVFLDLDLARAFGVHFLSHIRNIKLLSIALPEVFVEAFLQEFKPMDKRVGENGVYKKLKQRQSIEVDASTIGYDVLGYGASDFESFVGGGAEKDFHQMLGITFNQYGLIDSFDSALSATNLIRDGVISAELGYWAAWRISEYSLSR